MPLDLVKSHTPFSPSLSTSREVAAVRSPILDLPVNDWPEDSKGNEKPTALSWIMDTGFDFLPLAVHPFVYQYFVNKLSGGKVLPFRGQTDEQKVKAAVSALGFFGDGYSKHVEKIESLREFVRVSGDDKSGFKLSMAVAVIDMATYINNTRSIVMNHLKPEDAVSLEVSQNTQKIAGASLIKWLGLNAVDPAKPVDIRIKPSEFFESGPIANKQLLHDIVEDSNKEYPAHMVRLPGEFGFTETEVGDALDYLMKSLTSIRLIGSPTSSRQGLAVFVTAQDGSKVEISDPDSAAAALKAGHKAAYMQYYIGVQDSRSWYLYLDFDVPAWVAPCIFCTDKTSDPVKPVDMSQWVQQWMNYRQSGENVWLYRRFADIAKHNDNLKASGIKPKARTDANGITIHPDLLAMWIPAELPTLDDYLKSLEVNVSPYTKEFTFKNPETMNLKRHEVAVGSDMLDLVAKQGVKPNQLIYIDWFNNKLSYTNTSGMETILDIERCMPGRPFTMRALLSAIIYGEGSSDESNKATISLLSMMLRFAKTHGGLNPVEVFESALDDDAKKQLERLIPSSSMNEVYRGLSDGDVHVFMVALCGTAWRSYQYMSHEEQDQYAWVVDMSAVHLYETSSKSKVPMLAAVGAVFEAAAKIIDPVQYVKEDDSTVIVKLQAMAIHTAISKYSGNFTEVVNLDKADRAVYLNVKKPDPNYKPSGFVLTSDRLEFMPHQARIADQLQATPPNALLNVQAGGGKCLTGEALVPTSDGLMRLDELYNRETGPIHDGFKTSDFQVYTTEGVAKATSVYSTRGKTIKVMLRNGMTLEGLPEHKLYVWVDGGFKFVRLDELKPGMHLPRHGATGLFGSKVNLDTEMYDDYTDRQLETHYKLGGKKLPTKLTPELAALFGFIVSEGYVSDDWNVVNIEQHDSAIRQHIYDLAVSVFGPVVHMTETAVQFKTTFVKNWLKTHIYGKSAHKFVPLCIRQAPRRLQQAFLRALWEGDGCAYVSNGNTTKNPTFGSYVVSYTTISKQLAEQVLCMLENLGIYAYMSVGDTYESQGGPACVYEMYVDRTSFATFEKVVGFISDRKRNILTEAVAYVDNLPSNGQGTNVLVFGAYNRVPVGNQLERAMCIVMDIAKTHTFPLKPSINRWGSVRRERRNYTTRSIYATIGGYTGSYPDGYNDNGVTTRYHVDLLFQLLRRLPARIRADLSANAELQVIVGQIKTACTYLWTSIQSVKKGHRVKQVYDISVPGPHNYAVGTVIGHNTITILTNIAYEIGKGTVKHPLVMCPSHLVKDYVNEANFTFSGRFNIIVVTNESLRSWGEEKLLKLVKGAPPNSIVVTDFNFLSSRLQEVYYGNNEYNLSLNCELLRTCDFDGVWVDEIHYLRNVNQRSVSAQRLLMEIPLKRGASGTLIVTQLTDMVNEIALFDPTLFGSRERFLQEYALQMTGSRVSLWKPGAEQAIHRTISEHCMMLSASRKEWASLLPPRVERFHYVPLSQGQRALYESILEETMAKIKEDDPEMYAKLIANRKGSSEEEDAALEQLVRRYLSRLETFLGAPGEDQDADLLSEEDKISPKGKKMVEILREHLAKKIPGKVLIYCSNHKVVNALFAQMPQDLLKMTIHYTAQNKFKDAQEFRSNPEKQFMIGIEDSMRTGLNLQFASRIIRIQSVWTPGDLEQGESRINRPNLKDGKDARTAIYYDHIIVNRTVDVTKTARLIAYMISSSKFENPYELPYQAIESPELVSMSYENLMSENDFTETLSDHMKAFQQLRGVQEAEYKKYREDPSIPKEFKPVQSAPAPKGSGLLRQVPYVSGMEIYGADDLGLEPFYDHLRNNNLETSEGLKVHTEWGDGVITKEYKGTITVQLADGGAKVSVNKMAAFVINRSSTSTKEIRQQILKMVGMSPVNAKDVSTMPVSPVIGEAPMSRQGISRDDEVLNVAVKKAHPKEVDFRLQLRAEPFNVWRIAASVPYYVVTKANNPFKIKEGQRNVRVYKEAGSWVWVDEDNESMTGGSNSSKDTVIQAIDYLMGVQAKKKSKQQPVIQQPADEEQPEDDTSEEYKGVVPPVSDIDHEFYLGLGVLNGEFFLSYNGDDETAAKAHLQKFGFKTWNRYPTWYIEIRRAAQLRSLIEQMEEKYTVKPIYLQPLKDALSLFNQGKQRMLHPNAAIASEFRNFMRDHIKPPTSPTEIKPYIYVSEEDGSVEFYVVVDARSAAANKLNNKIKIAGTRWYKETDTWLGVFVQKRTEVKEIISDMLNSGLKVANLDEVKDQYIKLNPQKRRHTDAE